MAHDRMTDLVRCAAAALTLALAACASEPPAPPPPPPPPPPAVKVEDPPARIAALQPPVWVERSGGRKEAARVGVGLRSGDTLSTGAGGRLQVVLADASTVKLGESAELAMPEVSTPRSNLLNGVLHVVRGAFRYTTSALDSGYTRDLTVRIGSTVTAGIRGTDLWGKGSDQEDLLCLIEGTIEVSSPGVSGVVMDQPRTVFVVPSGKAAAPVSKVSGGTLKKWAAETELAATTPAFHADGQWTISLVSQRTLWLAEQTAAAFSEKGYGVEIREAVIDGETWYRVVMPGMRWVREARALIPALEQELGIKGAWVPARE